MAPRNRKERRAAATASSDDNGFDPASVPLARPPENSSRDEKAKTLYELAAERQAELAPQQGNETTTEFVKITPSGEVSTTKAPGEDDLSNELLPLPDTILLSLPLSALHFTLSFLAAHQYAQQIPVGKLVWDTTLKAFPALTFIIHLAHGHIISFDRFVSSNKAKDKKTKKRNLENVNRYLFILKSLLPRTIKDVLFTIAAVLLAANLIATTNQAGYYAVMKKTPPIGTLLVWCILEIPVGPALFGIIIPVVWGVYFKGYSLT